MKQEHGQKITNNNCEASETNLHSPADKGMTNYEKPTTSMFLEKLYLIQGGAGPILETQGSGYLS